MISEQLTSVAVTPVVAIQAPSALWGVRARACAHPAGRTGSGARRARRGAAEPVRNARVELGRLARAQHQVVLAEHEPQLAAEDVQPLVALVHLQVGFAGGPRLVGMTSLYACNPPGRRVSGKNVMPLRVNG